MCFKVKTSAPVKFGIFRPGCGGAVPSTVLTGRYDSKEKAQDDIDKLKYELGVDTLNLTVDSIKS